jgi:hypothetical protein
MNAQQIRLKHDFHDLGGKNHYDIFSVKKFG